MSKILLLTDLEVQLLKSNPPQIIVNVRGAASTPGWTNLRLEISPTDDPDDDVLEYQFVGDRPTGVVPSVLTSVSASVVYSGKDAESYAAVLVRSRANTLTSSVPSEPPKPIESTPNPVTTLRFGEESPPLTTLMLGEESFGPTTDPRLDDPAIGRIGLNGPWGGF